MPEHWTISADTKRSQTFRKRLAAYNELRDSGLSSFQAAQQLGLDPWRSADRYEAWRLTEKAADDRGE